MEIMLNKGPNETRKLSETKLQTLGIPVPSTRFLGIFPNLFLLTGAVMVNIFVYQGRRDESTGNIELFIKVIQNFLCL